MFARLKSMITGEEPPPNPKKLAQSDPLATADTLRQCLQVYLNAEANSLVEARAVDKIVKLARSFSDWIEIYRRVSPDSKLGRKAVEKIKETAKSVEDWRIILDLDERNQSLEACALEKMANAASSFDEWALILSRSSKNGDRALVERAEAELGRLAGSFRQWFSLYTEADERNALKLVAARKAVESANDLDDLVCLYRETPDGDAAEVLVLDAIKASRGTFASWKQVYDDDVSDELRDLAFEKMTTKAQSFSDWTEVCDYAENRGTTEVLDKATAELSKMAASFSEWKELFERADEDSPFELTIVAKAIAAASSIDELVELHKAAGNSSKAEALVFEAIKAREGVDRESWRSVFDDEEITDDLVELSFERLAMLSIDVDQVFELCELADGDDDRMKHVVSAFDGLDLTREAILEKMREDSCPTCLHRHALGRILFLSSSVPELIELDLLTRSEDISELDCPEDLEELIAAKVAEIGTENELKLIVLLVEEGSELSTVAERKLLLMKSK